MTRATVLRSPDIPVADLNEIESELTSLGMSVENQEYFARSQAGGPSFVQIMADVLAWVTPLKVAATIFLSELAKLAAQDLWKNKKAISSALAGSGVIPLRRLARAFSSLNRRLHPDASVVVGLPVPDDYFGTVVAVRKSEEGQTAFALATFISRAEEIQAYVARLANSEFKPVGPVIVDLTDDGRIVLRWMDRKELKRREADLTYGKPAPPPDAFGTR